MGDSLDRAWEHIHELEKNGCGRAPEEQRRYDDHETRLRTSERLLAVLGEKPADHEGRLRTVERLLDRAAGAAAVIGGLAGLLASIVVGIVVWAVTK